MAVLDFSKASSNATGSQNAANKYLEVNEEEDQKLSHNFIDSDQSLEFESDDEKQQKKKNIQKKGGMFAKLTGKIKNLTGN